MTVPRQVVAGRTHLISRRCSQRLFLMRPDPRVEQIFLYCLGEAASRYGITLHGWIALSNHEHLSITDNLGNFPEFLAHLHKMLAKCLNAYWGRWENLFAAEQANAVWCVEPGDGFDKLIYLLVNPVADLLTDRVADWPGACSWPQHLSGLPKTVQRPHGFFSEDGVMPEEVTLRAERLAGFENLTDDQWRDKIAAGVHKVERDTREERLRSGRRIVGRKAILRASHTDSPSTVEPRRKLRPHVACKNEPRRIHELLSLRAFRIAYRAALAALREGLRDLLFPFGTYKLRSLGAHCSDPPPPL